MRTPGYRCANKRCSNLVMMPGTRCHDCRRLQWAEQDRRRGTSTERGYDRTWRGIRDWFLRRNPTCNRCEENGRIIPATEVHHKIPKASGGSDDIENLEALCHACHSAETMKELNRGGGTHGRPGDSTGEDR